MIADDNRQTDPQTYAVIGAAMHVHRALGHGFLEQVYHEALAIEFEEQRIPFKHELDLSINYRGRPLSTRYRADFVCYGSLLVELKASSALTGADQGQLLNYLKATRHPIGLLINFGTPSLQFKRMVFSSASSVQSAEDA